MSSFTFNCAERVRFGVSVLGQQVAKRAREQAKEMRTASPLAPVTAQCSNAYVTGNERSPHNST